MKKISVVVPTYNEAAGVAGFLDGQLLPVLRDLSYKVEVIVVDDGSSDKTLERVKESEICKRLSVKVVVLSKNFGKEVRKAAIQRVERATVSRFEFNQALHARVCLQCHIGLLRQIYLDISCGRIDF